jgi:cellulose synthase/poly-beta-1,6-N-acetylglucosamine synthase-like glycosyltransferase
MNPSIEQYEILTLVLFSVYGLALIPLSAYGLMQIYLVVQYLRARKKDSESLEKAEKNPAAYPFVTVQLPVYNERYVTERLIDAVARFTYPQDQFEVQVLDDSTDDTVDIVAAKVKEWQAKGVQIAHIRRSHRTGYKAGALQEGLTQAKGEFIAIFDADFVPEPDFLNKTIPAFDQAGIGMVQTRWDHLNKKYSLLTHLQAFLIDAHFSVEQLARNRCGYFMNFCGTGGIWRKTCIEDAGGWHSDTLTEDFDLSYRAQLKGWQFKYLEHVGSPAELPPLMSALKSQQYRWIKGIAETAKKHVPNVLKAKMPVSVKVHALFHLLVGVVFICAFTASFLSVPLLFLKQHVLHLHNLYTYASFSLLSLLCLTYFHYVSTTYTRSGDNSPAYFLRTFPFYLSFSMGISLHNALAVVEGFWGVKTPFTRTPKFNVGDSPSGSVQENVYRAIKLPRLSFVEAFFVLYFLGGAALGLAFGDFSMFPYHLMLAFGFGLICYYSWKETQSGK